METLDIITISSLSFLLIILMVFGYIELYIVIQVAERSVREGNRTNICSGWPEHIFGAPLYERRHLCSRTEPADIHPPLNRAHSVTHWYLSVCT